MRGATTSNHAAVRMAQRGFDNDDLAIIQMIGIEVEGGYFVREKDCQELERRSKQMLARVRKLAGTRVVIADNQIITAYHTEKAKERSLLRHAEERELASSGGGAMRLDDPAFKRR